MSKQKTKTLLDNELLSENVNMDLLGRNGSTLHERFINYTNILKASEAKEKGNLEDLELKKQIEISKIEELDAEIELLTKKRLKLLDNIASIEQDELKQNLLEKVDSKKAEKQRSQSDILENIKEEDSEILKPPALPTSTNKNAFSSHVLPKNKIKHNPLETRRHSSVRKLTPILQNYYNPLTLINKFTLPSDGLKLLDFDIPFGQMFSVTSHDPKIINSFRLNNSDSKHTNADNLRKEDEEETDQTFIRDYVGHKGSINCLHYKSNLLLTGAKDAVLNVYNCEDSSIYNSQVDRVTPLASLDSHIDEITCLSYDGHVLVSGSQDRTVRQWDLTKMCCVNTLDLNFVRNYYKLENANYSSTSITPGNNSWITNSSGMRSRSDSIISRSTSVFDFNAIMNGTNDYGKNAPEPLSSPTIISSTELVKQSSSESCTFDEMNQHAAESSVIPKFISQLQVYDAALATGTSDGIVRLWDIRAQRIMRQLPSNMFTSSVNTSICDMKFDSHQLITTNYSNELMVWDLRMGKVLKLLKIGNSHNPSFGVQFEIDKKKLIIKDNGTGAVYLYDRKSNEFIDWKEKAKEQSPYNVECIRLKGGYLLEGYQSGIIKSWAV